MNEPHDPNVTSDLPSVPAESLRAADAQATIDRARGSGDGAPADPEDRVPIEHSFRRVGGKSGLKRGRCQDGD